jgi:hypothetical protein
MALLLQLLSALKVGPGIFTAQVSTARALIICKAASSEAMTENFMLRIARKIRSEMVDILLFSCV